jgi:hypothetical protein
VKGRRQGEPDVRWAWFGESEREREFEPKMMVKVTGEKWT